MVRITRRSMLTIGRVIASVVRSIASVMLSEKISRSLFSMRNGEDAYYVKKGFDQGVSFEIHLV